MSALSKCDILVSGGGSLLQDATSVKSLFYYLWVIFMAQFYKKQVLIFAQGIGPHSPPQAGSAEVKQRGHPSPLYEPDLSALPTDGPLGPARQSDRPGFG